MNLRNIEHDKLLHSFYGTAIYIALALISPAVAVIGTFLVAIAKEFWDSRGHGYVDIMDVLFTILFPVLLYIESTL